MSDSVLLLKLFAASQLKGIKDSLLSNNAVVLTLCIIYLPCALIICIVYKNFYICFLKNTMIIPYRVKHFV